MDFRIFERELKSNQLMELMLQPRKFDMVKFTG